MATTDKLRSFTQPPPSHHVGVQTIAHNFLLGDLANFDGTINSLIYAGKIPRGASYLDCALNFSVLLDSHATPTGDVGLILTNGTTTYTLIAGKAAETVALHRGETVAAIGKVLTGNAEWDLIIKVTTAIATVNSAGAIGFWCNYTMDARYGTTI